MNDLTDLGLAHYRYSLDGNALVQHTKGRTWKTYRQSLRQNWNQEIMDSYDRNYHLCVYNFHKLLIVPGMLNRFHKSPYSLQMKVLEWLDSKICVWMIAGHLELLQSTQVSHEELWKWGYSDLNDSHNNLIEGRSPPSSEFESKLRLIIEYSDVESNFYHSRHKFSMDFLSGVLLGFKYGEPRVIEIMDLWLAAKPEGDLLVLIELVKKWRKYKDYPLSWSASLIGQHVCA